MADLTTLTAEERRRILDDYLDTFDRLGIDYVLPPTKAFLERRAPVSLHLPAAASYTMPSTGVIFSAVAGTQNSDDGRSALGYVRTRATPRADLDRMVNQRQFMSALLHRAASPTVLLNPLRWYPMAHALTDAIAVGQDDHVWDLTRLGWALRGDVVTTTVPLGEFTGSASGSVVTWDSDAASRLFAALSSDSPVPQDVLDAADPD